MAVALLEAQRHGSLVDRRCTACCRSARSTPGPTARRSPSIRRRSAIHLSFGGIPRDVPGAHAHGVLGVGERLETRARRIESVRIEGPGVVARAHDPVGGVSDRGVVPERVPRRGVGRPGGRVERARSEGDRRQHGLEQRVPTAPPDAEDMDASVNDNEGEGARAALRRVLPPEGDGMPVDLRRRERGRRVRARRRRSLTDGLRRRGRTRSTHRRMSRAGGPPRTR